MIIIIDARAHEIETDKQSARSRRSFFIQPFSTRSKKIFPGPPLESTTRRARVSSTQTTGHDSSTRPRSIDDDRARSSASRFSARRAAAAMGRDERLVGGIAREMVGAHASARDVNGEVR